MPAGWRGLWTTRRARLWLAAAIAAAWLPVVGVPLRGWLDFAAFYGAGKLVFTADVARLGGVVQFEQEHGLPIVPFVYPAGLALLYAPLSALPFDLAGAIHLALQFAALLGAAWIGGPAFGLPRPWAVIGAIAWAPATAGVLSGQNTAVALLLVAVAVSVGDGSQAPTRSPFAGLAIGGLLYKPQLGLPLVALVAWRGAWRAFAVALAGLGAWYLAGVAATSGNPAWPSDWLATLGAYRPVDLATNGWQAVSLPLLLERLDLTVGLTQALGPLPSGLTILGLAGYSVGAAVVLLALPALRQWTWAHSVALACALGLFMSPHAWVYDATLLLPALAVIAANAARLGWPWQHRWLLATAYLLAAAWPVGGVLGVTPVAAAVLLTPPVLLAWRPFGRWVRVGEPSAAG